MNTIAGVCCAIPKQVAQKPKKMPKLKKLKGKRK